MSITNLIASRFPDLMKAIQGQVERVTQPEALQDLIVKVSLARNSQEAQLALASVNDELEG